MTLDEFLTHENDKLLAAGKPRMTDADFGGKVGLSQSQISRLRRKESRPSWETMEKIQAATNGKVKATSSDWPSKTMEAAR